MKAIYALAIALTVNSALYAADNAAELSQSAETTDLNRASVVTAGSVGTVQEMKQASASYIAHTEQLKKKMIEQGHDTKSLTEQEVKLQSAVHKKENPEWNK